MSSHTTQSDHNHPDRGPGKPSGRGKSRAGLGKYLRARGRRGYGRPAEFNKRLLLDGERPPDNDEEAEQLAAENAQRYSRRPLASNADRYNEPEPELGSDGEPILEPQVDLSSFLERQKLSSHHSPPSSSAKDEEDSDDDIDHDIAPLLETSTRDKKLSKKGRVEQIEWTEELEALHREKLAADAARDLKERFRATSSKLRTRPVMAVDPIPAQVSPPPLAEGAAAPEPKDSMMEMENFLDELLK